MEDLGIWYVVQVCAVWNHAIALSAHGYGVSEGQERDIHVA